MNEALTRAQLIDPVLRKKGWRDDLVDGDHWIPEEVFPGRIDSEGNHQDPGRCDYVLYCGLERVAILEAKADEYEYDKGETQARYYAAALGVRFTYSTNGQKVLEIDTLTQKTRTFAMKDFPSPEELVQKYGKDTRSELEKRCADIPFSRGGGKFPYYYQQRAVEAVIRKLGNGEKRALLTLATGTGKTFIAYQLCHKLVEAKWSNGRKLGDKEPQVLFITDRNILADQAQGDFYFPERSCFRYLAGTEKVPMDRKVYFTLFQTLLGEDGTEEKYKKFDPDFFDLVIIDECHRGGANDESQWRKILDYFKGACHVGLTATPKCDVNGETYKYFGKPAYRYSLGMGIHDGFLTPFRVDELKSTLSQYQVTDGDIIDYPDEVDPHRKYGNDQIEHKRMLIDERDRHFVDVLMERMPLDQKAIVFCVTQSHARRIARIIKEKAVAKGITDPNYCEVVTADSGSTGEGYLKAFQNNENTIPTILTTSQKLSTGVNAKNIRSIVLFRNVGSMVEFKQIIGRGTRAYPGKGYFKIYDFAGASRQFEDPAWDSEDPFCPKCGQNPCVCKKSPPKPCPKCGKYPCECPPEPCPKCGHLPCICPAPVRPTITITLSPTRSIESHWEDFVFVDGKKVSVQDFIDQFIAAVKGVAKDKEDLRKRWANPETRQGLFDAFSAFGFAPDQLKVVQKMVEKTECDVLDVMLDLVYGVAPLTRAWRASHLDAELAKMNDARRGFAEVVLAKYVEDGVWSLNRATLFNYIKMKFGSIDEAMKSFDCPAPEKVVEFYGNLQENIYAVL